MLLVIDVGNSNIVFGLFDNKDKLIGQWRMLTHPIKTADEYFIFFKLLLASEEKIDLRNIKKCLLSSVVPDASFHIELFIEKYLSIDKLFIIGRTELDFGIKISVDNPSEVGADRIVNSLAAYHKYKADLIVIDFGTATTFDVVTKNGEYIGGVISPGINLSLKALERATAKLPMVEIRKGDKVIGKNTISAIESGIFYGYLGLIEGIIDRIKKEYVGEMIVIATGGLANLFFNNTDSINFLEEDLNIIGMNILYNNNDR